MEPKMMCQRRYMKMLRTLIIYGVVPFLLAGFILSSQAMAENASHLDKGKNRFGCSACHSAHGKRGAGTLRDAVPELCFNCHSPFGDRLVAASTDVYGKFSRQYRHPVEDTARYHQADEDLPEKEVTRPRHVSCLDCHRPHLSESETPMIGSSGYSSSGQVKKKAESISEVCYKCHSESVNLPVGSPNTREEFLPSNASYHPVERFARSRSISVISELSGKTMECIDCHDPHGSDNKFMLRFNYAEDGVAESPYAYELCYSCHRRESILSDQSFRAHARHIRYENTSCRTCHNAHGTRFNDRLIDFDPAVVMPDATGAINYTRTGNESNCYLTCHEAEHKGATIVRLGVDAVRKRR